MSIPERFLFDNLVWTSTGDIWATWRLTPLQRPVTENASLTVAAGSPAPPSALSATQRRGTRASTTWTSAAPRRMRRLAGLVTPLPEPCTLGRRLAHALHSRPPLPLPHHTPLCVSLRRVPPPSTAGRALRKVAQRAADRPRQRPSL